MLHPLPSPLRFVVLVSLASVLASVLGCEQNEQNVAEQNPSTTDSPAFHWLNPARANPSSRVCEVDAPGNVQSIAASKVGLAYAVSSPTPENLIVHRAVGTGCTLTTEGQPAIAAARLYDADDLGRVYVSPAESSDPAVLSSKLPDTFDTLDSTVMRVEPNGQLTRLAYSGRGIWSFGVSPDGQGVWMTACGPTGVFSVTDEGLVPSLDPPNTLWAQSPNVLTDATTFWSVGLHTCTPPSPLTPSCGAALVRATQDETLELNTTLRGTDTGYEEAQLAKCGSRVCGVFSKTIVLWDSDGHETQTITSTDLSMRATETLEQVSGTERGVYALVRGELVSRIVFVDTSQQ